MSNRNWVNGRIFRFSRFLGLFPYDSKGGFKILSALFTNVVIVFFASSAIISRICEFVVYGIHPDDRLMTAIATCLLLTAMTPPIIHSFGYIVHKNKWEYIFAIHGNSENTSRDSFSLITGICLMLILGYLRIQALDFLEPLPHYYYFSLDVFSVFNHVVAAQFRALITRVLYEFRKLTAILRSKREFESTHLNFFVRESSQLIETARFINTLFGPQLLIMTLQIFAYIVNCVFYMFANRCTEPTNMSLLPCTGALVLVISRIIVLWCITSCCESFNQEVSGKKYPFIAWNT